MDKQASGREGPSVADHAPEAASPRLEAPGAAAVVAGMRRADPPPLTPRGVLQLQRAVGNRAVGRLLARAAQRRPDTAAEAAPSPGASAREQPAASIPANRTGLPDELKSGIERLSGLSMDDVRVQRNSAEPARLHALAIARGSEIHLGPGQERYLPHEAWHVVQQKQGRVPVTTQLRGVRANTDSALEREADQMGERARAAGRAGGAAAEPRASVPLAGEGVVQGVFTQDDLEFIQSMPRQIRIEYLSRVSPEDLRQFIDTDFFDSQFGLSEELDEIREARQLTPEPEEGFSTGWLDPVPAGNARAAARELAMLSPPQDVEFEEVIRKRDAFLTLMRRKVKVAYLEELEREDAGDEDDDEPASVRGDSPPRYLHPDTGVPFQAPPPGTSLYFMGYVFASRGDSVQLWTRHLLDMVERSGATPEAVDLGTIEEDAELDALLEQMSKLSVDEPKVTIDRKEYDADGDVVMKDVTGSVDVDMTDVHGSLDVTMEDVPGYVAMDVEHLRGDFQIHVSGVRGYVHLTLMDVDLKEDVEMAEARPRGRMRIDITGVDGSMEIEIINTDDPMDVTLGPVGASEHVVKRVGKRRHPVSQEPPSLEAAEEESAPVVKRARREVPKPSGSGSRGSVLDLEDLIESMENLSISFRAAIDGDIHQIYPAQELTDVIVHSNPTPLDTIVKSKKWQNVPLLPGILATLKGLQQTATAALQSFGKQRTKGAGTLLRKAMKAIAKHLATVGVVDVPPTNMAGSTYHGSNAGKTEGTYVVANPLSLNSKQGGHGPSKDGRLMTAIRKAAGTESKSYKQMHLLNDNVFGPGELWNLTPGPAQSNIDMEKNVEHYLKRAILDKGLVITFEATVHYRNDPVAATDTDIDQDPDKHRFDKITFKAKEHVVDAKAKQYVPQAPLDSDVKAIDGARVDWKWGNLTPLKPKPKILSTVDPKELEDVGIRKADAARIVAFTKANGVPNLKPAKKKEQLAELIKQHDGKKKISISWDASRVLWS